MRPNPTYAGCVRRAAALLGSWDELAARLGVSPRVLERWAAGRSPVPEKVFLRLVDILSDKRPPS